MYYPYSTFIILGPTKGKGLIHGVGVITKLYFAIFVAFKEVILNLAQRSSKVIDFGTNRKRVYIFLLVANSNLDPIWHCFRDTADYMSKSPIFPTQSYFG